MNLFENRIAIIVTKHGKEEVIKPLLENALSVKCYVSNDFNTDVFGTFSGEINRNDDSLTTLRKKCLAAMDYYKVDLAIASEGSFGPHPTAFFAPADDELVILIDKKNNLEIIGRHLSLETNFAAKEISDSSSFKDFLNQIQFPSHKVILKNTEKNWKKIHKGAQNEEEVYAIFQEMLFKYASVYVETDMRAMYNPTRMMVIKQAVENLIQKVGLCCPICQTPGFSAARSVAGLPCQSCNSPTKSILYNVLQCQKCNHQENKYFPRNLKYEDPTFCDNCNP